ncbi:hypothetical protein [Dyadobacter sp. CY326]|uniref:hypothetical protein n=1 Tax=Dyadobacter sp. CY326 TaxID=2907300 RepID=UPI001F1BFA64|nr:hypothetical protein [Dyadobacter sp. CY326]MCE7067348.1 hypothetical protein [Dyadobacter sp. CY326]
MNLVQKLPIGLGLACLMMMSSCSKEDVQTPAPAKSERSDANMRDEGGFIKVFPIFNSTFGQLGCNIHPNGWSRSGNASSNAVGYPTGNSSLAYLFGNPAWPWEKALPSIPGALDANNSILTVSTSTKINVIDFEATAGKRSAVETKIKNLKPGKLYKVTFWATTTVSKVKQNNKIQAYAHALSLDWIYPDGKENALVLSLNSNNAALWKTYSITFEAKHSEQVLTFTAFTKNEGEFAYAHLFVDHNSIKEVESPSYPNP